MPMTPYHGFFQLKTPPHLFEKLCREYERLRVCPTDVDVAFNFFVTAEHLLDWLYPNDAKKREETRKGEVLLQVCSHIANGAKHFEATYKQHTSVKGTVVSAGGSQASPFGDGRSETQMWLVVVLDREAEKKLGPTIEVLELGRKLMAYWTEFFRNYPKEPTP